MTERVLVYGTLRRDGSNGHRMKSSRFLGEASVRGRLYRVDCYREFAYPAFVPDGDATEVRGELFEVPPEVLAELDEFEGDEYDRILLPLVQISEGLPIDSHPTEAWVWTWKGSVQELTPLPGGDWLQASELP
ncbi:gamma-glutamylcyclotransferase (GGCT)/AIG2-like uncharacterized protein YtfP [Haloferula luteola]|uniref:Gamma-glutamylcyclotransferase family protein n=1 Tax=Haloferula luteola TaxID=595692 RepID=A0A840V4E7_9BACT|nr:gamma-glutamylcyclotransferase family protein [Haloferula luteola]MBB5350514.1 gamma-glutamylcyclotransferase (GGCT)/AIG2-like uncharacterized protein YtfP [Haloferula luteola]